MCGRYTLKDVKAAAGKYGIAADVLAAMGSRFNICPSQLVPVVRPTAGGLAGEVMKWGLVPFWDESEKPKMAPINARSEEVLAKPTFRQSLQRRRCLVLADGFYEWQRLDEDTKIPFHIQLKAGRPFAMAGIFEDATTTRPATLAMLTTRPNAIMEPIHNRMPVILTEESEERWLTDGPIDAESLSSITNPYAADEMEAFAVSRLVNNPRNDAPECVEPVPDAQPDEGGGPNSR